MFRTKKGFSLLELILVLGVASAVSFIKFQDLKQEQENIQAKAVGQQIKQVGEAVNGYISIRFDKLSTLTSVTASAGTDPGPRSCSAADNTCTITYQTLINEGLLPASFSGINANHSSYAIILRRAGTSPNYLINGLITTTAQWQEGDKIRYDLLGKAMQTAGVDSGMSRTASSVSGYSGQWSEQAVNYNNITTSGLLAYRVGYDSAMYSVFLRRDGTLPMTGDLNMGGNDVNNVKNLTASGSVSAGALKSSGDTTVGGNLTVAGTSTLSGNARVLSRLATSGYSPDDLPSGWGGGIRTLDAYASGSIGAGTNGDVNTYLNSAGYIYAAIDANVGRQVNTQYVWATGNVNSNYLHSNGNIDANGRVNAGEFVYINGQSQPGWGCSPNGLQGRTPEGTLLSCVNGVWKSAGLGGVYIIQGNQACGQYATSNATCPGKLVSGGYYLSRWGGDGWNTPDNNFPSSAWTWTTFNGGGIRPGTCITAFALCTN